MTAEEKLTPDETAAFGFRPWVRRAGFSIVVVATLVTVAIAIALTTIPSTRYGWIGEPFVWVYIGTLWIGGAKVWLGTLRPVAEVRAGTLTLRPLHQFRTRVLEWENLRGTEQMTGGDRMIVYFDTPRGMRFVALNLNLVKGRRDFVNLIDTRLRELGFTERVVDRSRYLSKLPPA
ncbi:MAG TPA: hypothetical protein VGQ76_24470 [Thermoanaerobaculia bacterium]|jgi:hypothetical protein|nr:hypothetical protein [Thermoanaerobaculia bacterium]